MPPQRYYHNPAHLIPERAVYGAMQAVDSVEATLKIGQMPPQDLVRRVVDEVVDRLMQKQADLNNGLELRIVNQPHHRCHPVNVMVLSAVMGLAMGYDREQLRTLALGALFHDVGKTAIAPEVLHKQGPLTAQEIELLRAHPLIGKRIIDKMPWANATMGTIVYQHHERVDGSGYPLRLQGNQIHEMSRIVAVAEVYDSLVSDTAWRPRYAPELAYNAIKGGEKEGHDPNVIRAFLRYVFPYPLHAWVVMENNEIAQVVQVSRSNPTRPMIKIGNATYDLAAHPHRKILNVTYQAFY
jgi:HD-GYP domain-containing protein (c-di-GMP phosphodiesterase class II)